VIPGPTNARAVKLLSLRSLLKGCACVALVSVAGGCSAAPNAPTVAGKSLNIYLSAPASLGGNSQAQDVIDAEKLAFSSGCTSSSCPPIQLGGFTVHLNVLSASKISDNARTAIEDSGSVAYLGEVEPGASVDSLGITNSQDLLQVSPAQDPSVPTKDFESYSTYGRTFASMAPNSDPGALLRGAAGKAFVSAFRHTYGHTPSTQAIFGYFATAAVMNALKSAGSAANDRGTVRTRFFAPQHTAVHVGQSGPVLGTYMVKDGIVTITPASS
jgi:hypothetical protein